MFWRSLYLFVNTMNDSNSCKTAMQTWEKSISAYKQSSDQRADRVLEKFFSNEKNPVEDITTHITSLQRNFSELNDELKKLVNTELLELLLVSRIISTLLTEYLEFKSVWESAPMKGRSVNNLTERLRLIVMITAVHYTIVCDDLT